MMNLGATPSPWRRERTLHPRLRALHVFVASLRQTAPTKNWLSTAMPRPRNRACLQDGLKLDLNRLARKGYIKFSANIGIRGIKWSNSYWGEVASGLITADMTNPDKAWFDISIGGFRQQITLVFRPRHFGGRQWFFLCPVTHRLATMLWKPPGASTFCSRQAWGRQVAYRSQFLDRDNRAHAGKERIKAAPNAKGGDWNTLRRVVFT